MHELLDKVQVPVFECRTPFVQDKFNLFGLGHWVEEIGGDLPDNPEGGQTRSDLSDPGL